MMVIDEILPAYDFHEVHATLVHAPPVAVFRAIEETTPAEIPLFRALMGLRALPARLAGRGRGELDGAKPLLDQALGAGFVLLGEAPDRELVIGTIGRFWQLTGSASPRVADAWAFRSFDEPGYARAVMNFAVGERRQAGGVIVRTETRIHVPDPDARKQFARYWRVINPGSALIRRMWLRAIKRRAERTEALPGESRTGA